MTAIREEVAMKRNDPATQRASVMAALLRRLPAPAATAMYGQMTSGIDLMASNVPGPRETLYLGGAEVVKEYAFGPMAGAAVNISLCSYVDLAPIGVTVDRSAVTDPELFHTCLVDGFAAVLELADGGTRRPSSKTRG
jgi:diacylglycerol O-acyltransferase